jgi:hypothetical protein
MRADNAQAAAADIQIGDQRATGFEPRQGDGLDLRHLGIAHQKKVAMPAMRRAGAAKQDACRRGWIAVELLDGGATVPFIARYRKEATGGLDDTQLRKLEERLGYLRELEARRGGDPASIREQGKMTDDLAAAIRKAGTKAELEDIYLPYKPKRRTKAMIAREAGCRGWSMRFWRPGGRPCGAGGRLSVRGFARCQGGAGRRAGYPGRGAERGCRPLGPLARSYAQVAKLVAKGGAGKEAAGAKFSDYFAHTEDFAACRRTGRWRCCAGGTRRF